MRRFPTLTSAPIFLAVTLFLAGPVQANGGNTAGEMCWIQRGVYKTVQRNGYGKLRVKPMVQPQVTLGKMKRLKTPKGGAKWASAGGVVLDPGSNKVLLVRIRKETRGGRSGWTWPKGRLKPGEDPPDAAIRETFEEGGVQAQLVAKIAQMRCPKAMRHYYLMNKMGSGTPLEPRETMEVSWVSLKDAGKVLQGKRDRKVLRAAVITIKLLRKASTLP